MSSYVTLTRGGTTIEIGGPVAPNDEIPLTGRATVLTQGGQRATYRGGTDNELTQWRLDFDQLTGDEWTALRDFFKNTTQGPSFTFSYTHTDGETYTARFLDESLLVKRRNNNSYAVTFTLELFGQEILATSTTTTTISTTTSTTTTSTSTTTTTTTSTTSTSTTSTSTTSTSTTTTTSTSTTTTTPGGTTTTTSTTSTTTTSTTTAGGCTCTLKSIYTLTDAYTGRTVTLTLHAVAPIGSGQLAEWRAQIGADYYWYDPPGIGGPVWVAGTIISYKLTIDKTCSAGLTICYSPAGSETFEEGLCPSCFKAYTAIQPAISSPCASFVVTKARQSGSVCWPFPDPATLSLS